MELSELSSQQEASLFLSGLEEWQEGPQVLTYGAILICRGEFLLYWQGKYFGGIYDNRVLVKMTKTNERFGMPEAIPYEGAKAMYQVNIDNREEVAEVIKATCEGLK